jgi:hypothetical protein
VQVPANLGGDPGALHDQVVRDQRPLHVSPGSRPPASASQQKVWAYRVGALLHPAFSSFGGENVPALSAPRFKTAVPQKAPEDLGQP